MSTSAWMDTSTSSDESSFFAPSGNLGSHSSADTLDINTIPTLDHHASLIAESLTLDSLCSSDFALDHAALTFPSGTRKKPAQCAFISLTTALVIPKDSRRRRKHAAVLVSSPTPERLKSISQLRPVFDAWVSIVRKFEPPDLVPWCSSPEKPISVWMPEGSFFPPSYLKLRLRECHGVPEMNPPVVLDEPSQCLDVHREESKARRVRRRASFNPKIVPSHREALVLETQVHLTALGKGKLRRWSVSVPTSYINAELVERRLELQRLEASMRGDVDEIDANVAMLGEEVRMLVPEIKVSTSTATIPFSVLSAPSSPGNPIPLAVRRGHKLPAALRLQPAKPQEMDLYPGIPTAFQGSPGNYSPKFLQDEPAAVSTIGVGDMVENLRSQVANMKPLTPQDHRAHERLSPSISNTPLSAATSTSAHSDDEWAFAKDILAQYGDTIPAKTPAKHARSARKSLGSGFQIPASTKASRVKPRISMPGPIAASTPKERWKPSPITGRRPANANDQGSVRSMARAKPRPSLPQVAARSSRSNTPARSTPAQSSKPALPSTPANHPLIKRQEGSLYSKTPSSKPARPILSSSGSTGPKKIHGILKHAKSVRFAPPPERKDASTAADTPATLPRAAVRIKDAVAAREPSPLRESFTPAETRPLTDASSAKRIGKPRTSIAVENPARATPAPATLDRRRSYHASSPLRVDNLTDNMAGSSHLSTGHADQSSAILDGSTSPAPASGTSSPEKSPRARKSLPLLFSDKEKENKPRSFRLSMAVSPKRRKNENVARRDSEVGTPSSAGGARNRLSTPLKSILGRLRS